MIYCRDGSSLRSGKWPRRKREAERVTSDEYDDELKTKQTTARTKSRNESKKKSTNHFSVTSCSSAVCFVRSDVRVLVFGCHVLRYRSASSTMCTLFFSYYMDYRNKNRIRCSTGVPNKAPKMKIKRENKKKMVGIKISWR